MKFFNGLTVGRNRFYKISKTQSKSDWQFFINHKTRRSGFFHTRRLTVAKAKEYNSAMSNPKIKINSVRLNVQFIKHKDGVIAYAPALDLSTVGKTLMKAQKMIHEAVNLFLEDLIDRGTLDKVLSNLGWIYRRSSWLPPQPIKEKAISLKIPTIAYA